MPTHYIAYVEGPVRSYVYGDPPVVQGLLYTSRFEEARRFASREEVDAYLAARPTAVPVAVTAVEE